jgi:modulator of FtsH protease HflK
MRRLRLLPILAIAAYLLTGLVQIQPEERAVVRRFGRVVARPGPGLWVGLPYGMDRVDRIPTATIRRISVGFLAESSSQDIDGEFLTGDQNLVDVQVAVDYSLGDGPSDLEDFVLHRDQVDSAVAREAEAALADWIVCHSVDDVLLTGNASLPLWIVQRVQDRIGSQKLGIRVQQASVAMISPPDAVRNSFEEVNRAQTNARSQEQRAHQESNRLKQDADGMAYQLEQQASAYAVEKKSIAKAEAESFEKRLEQYRKLKQTNPDVQTAIWWDEMGRVWAGFRNRGRVELLDPLLGPDGLDLTHVVPQRKR